MSFQNQSGDLSTFTEVVPESARLGGLTKSSILTQRRRCRVTPQTGPTSAPSQQIQFLVADQGGLVDMRSVVINYTILAVVNTSGDLPCVDDGHCFSTVQVLLNGQLLDNVQNAMKLSNIEAKLGGSKSYYQTAGSFQGFELLNNDLNADVSVTSNALGSSYGYVTQNLASLSARCTRVGAAVTSNIAGEPRSIPLGLVSGVGRMKQYLPISILGELSLVLITGTNAEVLFSNSANTTASYTLSNISLEYDVVVPDTRYMSLLQKISSDGSDTGVHLPFESSIVTAGAAIASSATLAENTVIVSRATNHLLRASVVQIPTSGIQNYFYPSQSCFNHAGTWSYQMRIGSQVYPQIAAQGDASMFNTSLLAYGAVDGENGTCINRALWGNSSNCTTAGTLAVYETAQVSSGGTVKFYGADSYIPSYGFQTVKGGAVPLDVDGISLAGASGSQLIVSLVGAPSTAYTPYVSLVALKFIRAQSGAVSVVGA